MKKNLKIAASIFLVSGFLVACADGEEPGEPEEPMAPDAPTEQMPEEDDDMETDEGL